jgi:sulfoxide reductase heme-binding subunit YedZ
MIVPFVLMGPELVSLLSGQPGAVGNVAESTADILGTSSFLLMVLMLAVTPVHTMTGWTWHLPLRRDYGVAMFVTAALDLILAALTTGDTFGGLLGRIGGRTFLTVGTLAVLLLIPLAVTTPRRAHRWLGSYWKRLHRLIYVIWALVLLHLLLLFGFGGIFIQAVVVSIPLVVLRLPPVRRWWSASRRKHQHRILRGVLALALVATFVAGLRPIIGELAYKGQATFVEQPID